MRASEERYADDIKVDSSTDTVEVLLRLNAVSYCSSRLAELVSVVVWAEAEAVDSLPDLVDAALCPVELSA